MITGTFFRFVARRLDTRPEDYEDAEISDGAGELGFYSPHSWWPVLIALSASVTAVGVALWLPWLIVAGVCFVLATAAGPGVRVLHGRRKQLTDLQRSQSGQQFARKPRCRDSFTPSLWVVLPRHGQPVARTEPAP